MCVKDRHNWQYSTDQMLCKFLRCVMKIVRSLCSYSHSETFPVLQQRMRLVIQTEMQLAQMEEKYLDTESMNIDNSLERCKKLTGTLVTMKR